MRVAGIVLQATLLLTCGLASASALAETGATTCVQLQLGDLGYDPGATDGALGGKTTAAFESYFRQLPPTDQLRLGTLNRYNARFWCEQIGKAHPEIAHHIGQITEADWSSEHGFIFDVAPNVPEREVELIKEALLIAHDYLEAEYGGDIDLEMRQRTWVKVDATGRGNTEPMSDGANATALSQYNSRAPRPYFDVGHAQWGQDTSGRGWTRRTEKLKTVIHEYVHGWHIVWLTHGNTRQQPLGSWLNEGIAEYVAYNALIAAGQMRKGDVDGFMASAAKNDGELNNSLSVYWGAIRDAPAWPGHVAYLAVDWLVSEAPDKQMSLTKLGTEIARHQPPEQAFATAFNIDLNDFYAQFDVYREALRKNYQRALANRPALLNKGE